MSDAAVHLPLAGELREQEHQLKGEWGGTENPQQVFLSFFLFDVLLAEGATKEKMLSSFESQRPRFFFASLKTLCLDFYYFRRKPGIF